MATYAPTVITRLTKRALPVPTADAYAVGDNDWYYSDNNTNNIANRGVRIPAGQAIRIASGAAKFAYAKSATIITMTDA